MAVHDMTVGDAHHHLLRYAVPLVLGNLFQLAYNAVDSMIAGRFIGRDALAAEGIAGPLMNLVILGITGLCIGAGVFMSELFGAKKYKELRQEMATTVLAGFLFSIAAVLLGIFLMHPILRLMRVPQEIFGITALYLRIIFLGIPFTFLYNALAAALKSVGDADTPLKFLAFSSCLNAVLDLIFIAGLGFGIACSAVTTVVAEAVSALLSFVWLYKKVPLLRLKRGEFRIYPAYLHQTISYGAMTALQQSIQPIAKLMIQGAVNGLGVNLIAAYNAVTRIDDFAYTPEQSISHSITTFIAQNRGANKPERVRNGFRSGIRLEMLYWVFLFTIVFLSRRFLASLFVQGEGAEEIIGIASRYLGIMAFFYLFPGFTNAFQGFFRGVGNMRLTAVCTLIQAGIRAVFTYLLTPSLGIYGIPLACALGWSCMLLYEVPVYFRYWKTAKAMQSSD